MATRPRDAKKALARAGLLAASLALSLAAGEALFRLALAAERAREAPRDDGAWRARYRRMNETLYMRSDVPGLVYEPRPGSSIEMEYGVASFNAAGMRDTREVSETPGDRARVVVLGDSLVWSEFVALEDSLPRRLEETLGARHEVLNLGVTGFDTAQEALWYERSARRFHPALVVVVYCLNDMSIMSGPYERYADDEERRRKEDQDRAFDRLAPVRRETLDEVARRDEEAATIKLLARARGFWRRVAFDRRYVDEITLAAADPARVAATRRALLRLGRAIASDGARGLLVISPVLDSWGRYHWAGVHRTVARLGREAGLEVLDPLEDWRGSQDPSRLRYDRLHYSPRGHRLLARAIADAIERR
jgi:lysophospholipase L1-like esterase